MLTDRQTFSVALDDSKPANPFDSLPSELLHAIFEFIPSSSYQYVLSVCWKWRREATHALHHLDQTFKKVVDSSMEILTSARQVTALHLEGLRLTPTAFVNIRVAAPRLLSLSLRSLFVQDATIFPILEACVSLAALSVHRSDQLTSRALSCLPTALTCLRLHGCTKISNDSLVFIAKCTKLEVLDLGGTAVSGNELLDASARCLTHLKSLNASLIRFRSSADAPHRWADLNGITSLDLERCQLESLELQNLVHLRSLMYLDLSWTPTGDSVSEHIFPQLTRLKSLSLVGTPISDASAMHLSSLKTLESLMLTLTAFSDAGLPQLAALTALRDVYLSDTAVTHDALQYYRRSNQSVTVHFRYRALAAPSREVVSTQAE